MKDFVPKEYVLKLNTTRTDANPHQYTGVVVDSNGIKKHWGVTFKDKSGNELQVGEAISGSLNFEFKNFKGRGLEDYYESRS